MFAASTERCARTPIPYTARTVMIALVRLLLVLVSSLLKPKWRLAAENAALRYQLIVLRRTVQGRARLRRSSLSWARPALLERQR